VVHTIIYADDRAVLANCQKGLHG